MKKLLTVSLVAVMAVSAAHAKIASTDYVDGKGGDEITTYNTSTVAPINKKVGSADFKSAVIAKDAADVTAAVTALDTKLSQVASGSGLTLGANAVNTNNIVNGAVTLDKVASDVKNSITDAKQAGLDASAALETHKTEASNTYEVKSNKVATADAYSDLQGEAKAVAYPTYGAMIEYVEEAQTDLSIAVGTNTAAIETITKANGTIDTKVNALANGAVKTNTEAIAALNNTQTGALAQAKEYADDKVTELVSEGQVKLNTDAIAEMKNANVDGSLANLIKDEETRAKAAEEKIATYDAQGNLTGGSVKVNADAIAALNNTSTGALAQAKGYTDQKVGDLDFTKTAVDNQFVTGMVQVDGEITNVTTSTINDAVVALASVPTECGANGANKCALSVQKGTFTWEIIEN